MLYAFVADCTIFHEDFTWVQMLASGIILFTTVFTSVYKIRQDQKKAKLEELPHENDADCSFRRVSDESPSSPMLCRNRSTSIADC